MNIGIRIKQRRVELGLTQTELAERLECKNKSSVCKVERGDEPNLSTDRISKYANALNTTVAYLLGYTEDPNPNFDFDTNVYRQGLRDGEILRIISQLNDKNAMLIKNFAKTLLDSQE